MACTRGRLSNVELANELEQAFRLSRQTVRCRGGLLDHRRIFLRALIHGVDRRIDFLEPGGLLLGPVTIAFTLALTICT